MINISNNKVGGWSRKTPSTDLWPPCTFAYLFMYTNTSMCVYAHMHSPTKKKIMMHYQTKLSGSLCKWKLSRAGLTLAWLLSCWVTLDKSGHLSLWPGLPVSDKYHSYILFPIYYKFIIRQWETSCCLTGKSTKDHPHPNIAGSSMWPHCFEMFPWRISSTEKLLYIGEGTLLRVGSYLPMVSL